MASACDETRRKYATHRSDKVKVTILASEWGSSKGGLSTIKRTLSIQLAKSSDVEISFFVPQCSEKDKIEALRHNIRIVEARQLAGYEELDWLSFPPDDLQIEVVVGHGVKLGRQAQVIRRFHQCKWVQVVDTDPEEIGMFKYYPDHISWGRDEKHNDEVRLCEMADFVVAVGPKLAETFRSYLRFCKNDRTIFDFTPGIFEEFLTVEQVPEEGNYRRVLVFGHGDVKDFKLKGFDIAGKAIASLVDTCLVFVGAPDGKYEEIAAYYLMQCGLPANRLRVRGYHKSQESLKELFCAVDLVIMPSRTDGFGLTGLKALSAGLPVLVSKNSGFGEALLKVPFCSRFVINSDNPEVWAAAIKNIIWDKDKRYRLDKAQSMRMLYCKKYSWTKQSDALRSKIIKLARAHLQLQTDDVAITAACAQKDTRTEVHSWEPQAVIQEVGEPSTTKKQQTLINTGLVAENYGNLESFQPTQAILNRIADKYLQEFSPSNVEEYNNFMLYLKEMRRVLIPDVDTESSKVTVEVGSEKIVKELWQDYRKENQEAEAVAAFGASPVSARLLCSSPSVSPVSARSGAQGSKSTLTAAETSQGSTDTVNQSSILDDLDFFPRDPSSEGLFSSEKPETGESQLPRESSSEETTQSKRGAKHSEGVLPTKTKKKASLWTKTISVSSIITSEGGRVVGEGVKLVCPPGAVERPVTVTVKLEDPSKYCGLLVQTDLENDVMFCAPVINLQPNGHIFKKGVELTVRLKGTISSLNEVVILHGKETCLGTIAWEDITHNTIELNETSDEVLITTERFSIIAAFIKRTLILTKDIASRLNLLGFNHSLLVLFNDKSIPHQLAVIFVSEDVENEAFFQEDKTSVLVQLKEEGFREIFIPSVKGQDNRRIYNHEELKVSVSLGEDYKCSSSDLTVVVESSTWWSTGHVIKLPLESTEVKRDKILCGRITVKGKYGNSKERHFCELDIHGYIRGLLGVKGDIFNVIPIAEALKLPKEVLHEMKKKWNDDGCQLEVILEQTDVSSLKEVLEGLKPDYRVTTKRGQMHVEHIRYFATKIGKLEYESVELEKHFARKIHAYCQMLLRDCCLEMESTADGVGKAASSTKLDAFITIRMQGNISDSLKDFLFFACKDTCSSSEECIIEKFKDVIPELIQMIKEVFVDNETDYEEQNGLRGLSDEALKPFKLSIRIARQDNTVLKLMWVVGKILEKLCQQNCSYERESEVERWGKSAANLAMLDFLKPFFQNCPKNRRLLKRLELLSERTMDILLNPREFADEVFIRDFSNVALSLIDFAKFDASKSVRFVLIDSSNSRVNCSREYELNRNPSVFSQTVHVKKESEDELKLYASASVHMGGQIHKIGAFQSVIMLCESGWESFEKCRSPFHRVITAKAKDKDSENLWVVLCSSQKQELSEMLQVLRSEMSGLVDLTNSQVTQCPVTARNISAKAGKVLSLRLIYKWGSDSLDIESEDFVVCADSSARSTSFPELQLFGVSTAAHLDEAAATQDNPFPLASADVNFNFPVFQPSSQIPLNIQCQKVEYHLHHHNTMMQGHVCVVGDSTSLNNPMPAQGAIEEAQGSLSRLSLTDEKQSQESG